MLNAHLESQIAVKLVLLDITGMLLQNLALCIVVMANTLQEQAVMIVMPLVLGVLDLAVEIV